MTTFVQDDDAFRAELMPMISHMRAFARSLCGDPVEADDLVQESLAKAWKSRASYQTGTSLKSWTFTILRNQFYSDKRRSWRQSSLDPETAERTLVAASNPGAALELDEVRRALALLPDDQREALILVGVAGLPYEEVSAICDCAIGTIKSRVSRARHRLAEILAQGYVEVDETAPSEAMNALLADAQRLSGRRAA
ncbi:MAG TPA: sigma-70 family RNA polymerase sigma factor [Caulobacteraceae bacterium]|nr:sigma-70 family RNA polymerase sigma factor [Caulobacteraceae bacterium]